MHLNHCNFIMPSFLWFPDALSPLYTFKSCKNTYFHIYSIGTNGYYLISFIYLNMLPSMLVSWDKQLRQLGKKHNSHLFMKIYLLFSNLNWFWQSQKLATCIDFSGNRMDSEHLKINMFIFSSPQKYKTEVETNTGSSFSIYTWIQSV